MFIQEIFINQTEGYRFGDSGVYEAFTDDKGKLFRDLQNEYGRCRGKVYIDVEGKSRHIGWVFEKRIAYEDDSSKTYVREVWVTLHDAKPTTEVTYHHRFLD